MLEEFESYFDVIDVKKLRAFVADAKQESEEMRKYADTEKEEEHISTFLSSLLDNIEDEIQDVQSMANFDLKKKIRVYALIHLFHNLCDTIYDGDDEDDEDEDYEDEEWEEEEDEDEEDRHGKKGRVLKF